MRHLDADMLQLIVEGKLPPRLLLNMMCDHLRELCPECRANLEMIEATSDGPEAAEHCIVGKSDIEGRETIAVEPTNRPRIDVEPPSQSPYAQAFEGAVSLALLKASHLDDERREAQRDLDDLMAAAPEDWERRLRNDHTRFRSRALAEQMLETCGDLVRKSPRSASRLAELVIEVVDRIPGATEQTWAEELRVRAFAQQANALRVAGDLAAADATYRSIHAYLRENALELADLHPEVASLQASLRHSQGRTEEALESIDLAIRLSKVSGDTPVLARYLVARAEYLRCMDRLELAQEDLRSAINLLDPADDSHLVACAIGSQCLLLCQSGKADEAADLYATRSRLLEENEDAWVRATATFVRGAIANGLGDASQAEANFIEARDLYAESDQIFSASSVALDLAELYLETGRSSELMEIASWLGVLFDSNPHHQRATVALMLFQQASLAEQVTREAIQGLRRTLERAQVESNRSTFLPS